MGIHGLHSFLMASKVGKQVKLENNLLIVDGNGLLYFLFESDLKFLRNISEFPIERILADYESLYLRTIEFVKFLKLQSLTIHVIMDGKKENIKDVSRKFSMENHISNCLECRKCKCVEDARKVKSLPLYHFSERCFVEALKDANVEVEYSDGENDSMIAKRCKELKAYGILGLDSDFFIFDVPCYIPFSSLIISDSSQSIMCTAISNKEVADLLKINVDHLKVAACLIGNDYLLPDIHLKQFHENILEGKSSTWGNIIPTVAKLIRKNYCGKLSDIEFIVFHHRAESDFENDFMSRVSQAMNKYDCIDLYSFSVEKKEKEINVTYLNKILQQYQDGNLSVEFISAIFDEKMWPNFHFGEVFVFAEDALLDLRKNILQYLLSKLCFENSSSNLKRIKEIYWKINIPKNKFEIVDREYSIHSKDDKNYTKKGNHEEKKSNDRKLPSYWYKIVEIMGFSFFEEVELKDLKVEKENDFLFLFVIIYLSKVFLIPENVIQSAIHMYVVCRSRYDFNVGILKQESLAKNFFDLNVIENILDVSPLPEALFFHLLSSTLYYIYNFAELIGFFETNERLRIVEIISDRVFQKAYLFYSNQHQEMGTEMKVDMKYTKYIDSLMNIYSILKSHMHQVYSDDLYDKMGTKNHFKNFTLPAVSFSSHNEIKMQEPLSLNLKLDVPHQKVFTSSVAFIPHKLGENVETSSRWKSIQSIRAIYDKNFGRWMPHINMLYPFIPESDIFHLNAVNILKSNLKNVPSFRLRFSKFGYFLHKKSSTLFLEPETDPPNALKDLQALLELCFPNCNDLSRIGGNGFAPHLSLGQFGNQKDLFAALEELKKRKDLGSLFDWSYVNCLCLITRKVGKNPFETPFSVKYVLPLDNKIKLNNNSNNLDEAEEIYKKTFASLCPYDPFRVDEKVLDDDLKSKSDNQVDVVGPRQIDFCASKIEQKNEIKIKVKDDMSLDLNHRKTFRYNNSLKRWVSVDISSQRTKITNVKKTLKILTFNVLFDDFDSEHIFTEYRVPLIVRLLEECDPDIIGFQEVKPQVLNMLLKEEWIKKRYYSSDSESSETIQPYGQVLFSKFPFHAFYGEFSRYKKVIGGEFHIDEHILLVPVIHLTSSHHGKMETRIKQLHSIFDSLFSNNSSLIAEKQNEINEFESMNKDESLNAKSNDFSFKSIERIIIGDYNFDDGDMGEEEAFSYTSRLGEELSFVDCWKELKPVKEGITFDPTVNELAMITNPTSKKKRLDRIVIVNNGTEDPSIVPISVKLVGNVPMLVQDVKNRKNSNRPKHLPSMLYPSDHFGVQAELSFIRNNNRSSTDCIGDLKETISLKEMNGNENNGDMDMKNGQERNTDSFCNLNIADIENPIDIESELKNIEITIMKENNMVDDMVHYIESAVELLSKEQNERLSGQKNQTNLNTEIAAKVIPIGSYQIGTALSDSDVDILVISQVNSKLFFSKLPILLSSYKSITIKQVLNAQQTLIPLIRGVIYDEKDAKNNLKIGKAGSRKLHFEIQYSQYPFSIDKWFDASKIENSKMRRLDISSRASLWGYLDGVIIQKTLRSASALALERFQKVGCFIKVWAKRKGISAHRCGYIGGYSLSILVARIILKYPNLTESELIAQFFSEYAQFDWAKDIASLHPNTKIPREKTEVMIIPTVGKPPKNSSRNVVPSTLRIMKREFNRALDVILEGTVREEEQKNQKRISWERLLSDGQILFFEEYTHYVEITISAITAAEYLIWSGFIESRLMRLLLEIENKCPGIKTHLWPKRFRNNKASNFPFSSNYYIGLTKNTLGKNKKESENVKNSKTAFKDALFTFKLQMEEWKDKSSCMEISVQSTVRKRVGNLVSETDIVSNELTDLVANNNDNNDSNSKNLSNANELRSSETTQKTVIVEKNNSKKKKGGKLGSKKESFDSKSNDENKGKQKLRTSEESYKRIIYDPTLDASQYTIVYEDRVFGDQEVQLKSFRKPGVNADKTDESWIPWHRVWLIKKNGEIVWDRVNRIDRIG